MAHSKRGEIIRTETKWHNCKICLKKIMSTFPALHKHLKHEHEKNINEYRNISYYRKISLKGTKSSKEMVSSDTEDSIDVEEFQCPDCPETALPWNFFDSLNIRYHIKTNHKNRKISIVLQFRKTLILPEIWHSQCLYRCPVCIVYVRSTLGIRNHSQTIQGKRKATRQDFLITHRDFTCGICHNRITMSCH